MRYHALSLKLEEFKNSPEKKMKNINPEETSLREKFLPNSAADRINQFKQLYKSDRYCITVDEMAVSKTKKILNVMKGNVLESSK